MDNNQMDRYDPSGHGNGSGGGSGNNNGRGGQGNGNNGRRPSSWVMALAVLCTVILVFLFYNFLFGGNKSSVVKDYTDFLTDLESGRVESVTLDAENAQLTVTLTLNAVLEDSAQSGKENSGENTLEQYAYYMSLQQDRTYTTNVMESMDSLTARLEAAGVTGNRVITASSSIFTEILIGVISVAFFFTMLGIGAFAVHGDMEHIACSVKLAVPKRGMPRGKVRGNMCAEHGVHAIEAAGIDHALCAAVALLVRLEKEAI
jgi:predicted PurR-regulated permease PerM